MRLIRTMALGAVALSGLAACGQSDEAFRASYRTKAVEACNQGARSAPNSAGADMNRFCSCIVDRYMQATSTQQLRAERNQTTPPSAAQEAMMQCVREQGGAMSGAMPAPAPESSPAPPAPAEPGAAGENGAAAENSTAE